MACSSGLVSPPSPCFRRRDLAPLGLFRSGLLLAARNARSAPLRCCAAAVDGGVEDHVLGAAAASSKRRLPSKPASEGAQMCPSRLLLLGESCQLCWNERLNGFKALACLRADVLQLFFSILHERVVGIGSKLIGCGSAVPKFLISNDDLAQIVETSDEWISVRTGIRNRRVLTENETLGGLSVEAAKGALQMAQVDPNDVDLVIMCTSTPDDLFGCGAQVQRDLGCKNAWAFDTTAACSGFVVGLITATRFIKGGGFQNVLVIGADALSRYVDWTDRGTCILFGDAAGAVLVQACSGEEDGLLGFDLHSDGHGQRHLNAIAKDKETEVISNNNGAPLFPPKRSSFSCIQMNGKEVFRFAVRCVPPSIEAALLEAGLTSSSIDWLLLHQANQRIIDAVATRLQMPSDKVISNLANYGNTSAASIPLALDEAVRSGKVQAGNTIATAGFGAGLTWGSAIVRWK